MTNVELDAVFEAAKAVQASKHPVSALRVALKLGATDETMDDDEAAAESALAELAQAGRLRAVPVVVEWSGQPGQTLSFYQVR